MAQDPLLVDQIQIEPGAAGTRLIDRDPGTGALRFQDAVLGSPLALSQLAGLRNIANVLVVGKSGAGAQYTTVQAALDAVPSNASPTNPYMVLVMPGVYTETVNIVRDGVFLIGLGRPTIQSALEATPNAPGNDHTVIISAQLGTIPQLCILQNFRITNAHDTKACVRLTGGAVSQVGGAGQGIELRDCLLEANAAGGNRVLWATAVNRALLDRCWLEGTTSALLLVEEVASFAIRQAAVGCGVSLRYDTANAVPADAAVGYSFESCSEVAGDTILAPAVSVDLEGAGAFQMNACTVGGAQVQLSGDQQTFLVQNSVLPDLSLLETVGLTLSNSSRGDLVAPNANATLRENGRDGIVAFAAVTTVAVTFDIPYPAGFTDYNIGFELDARPANDETPWVTGKANTGFTINFFTAQTLNVRWSATVR